MRALLLCLAGAAGLTGLAGVVGCGCGRSGSTGSGGEPSSAPALAESAPRTAVQSDAATGEPCPVTVATLGPGLTVERWPINATPAAGGPACVDVVRADLARYALRALSAATGADPAATAAAQPATGAAQPATGAASASPDPPNAPRWLTQGSLLAVTNAGMFHANGDPVGLIVAGGTERGADNPKMGGFLAWDPVSPEDPATIIAGRGCPGFDLAALRRRYRSLVQSYRFLGCDGAALPWQDPKQYSAAGIGVDRAGRVVFFHARAAVTMAQLSKALASHDLFGALFLEGGPEASLVVHGPTASLDRVGSYETHFLEDDSNHRFWPLPNIIGLAAR